MEPVARIRNLAVRYGDRVVLSDVSFDLHPGEITVVIGPSGSGKSTLLRAVNRLNDLFPGCSTEGSVELLLDGARLEVTAEGIDRARLRRKAAMVFQSPNVLPVSIERNFSTPLRLTQNLDRQTIRARMERALSDAGLLEEVEDRLDESALKLSVGQQQRLCLARALALEPEILLLDEPTASVDFRTTERIEKLLMRLKDRYAILAVSHSLGQTSRIADRALILRDGRITERLDRKTLRDGDAFQRLVEEVF
ncbi:MAG: phosphate ABC transporter ATP-binding protein [Planctomycetota bacterium]|jgi:phosphate transport system ATP-binding protein